MNDHYRVRRLLACIDESYFGVHYVVYVLRMAKIHMHAIEIMLLQMQKDKNSMSKKVCQKYHAQCVVLQDLVKCFGKKMHKAPCKPSITFMRNAQWFGENDGVYVRTDLSAHDWTYGVITHVYAAKDGTRQIRVSSNMSQCRVCAWSDPCVIKEWEYHYFQRNRVFFTMWQEMSRMKHVYGMTV